ncbi:MAG: hypothetical protein AAB134_02390 [Pseudomonadota bacterium]
MTTACVTKLGWLLAGLLLLVSATVAAGGYRQVVDGVAIYFGVMPAELVRGHPREHPESGMHGGPSAGESHLLVALFDDKTGTRIRGAAITATIIGADGKIEKKLEPMVIEGTTTYGNYFYLTGSGPYRIALRIRTPGIGHDIEATFTWARS